MYYLNKGLRLCDTVLLVPLSFCAYNVSCLFNGLVYYDQWGRLFWWQILLVLFGISQVLVGVLVLAWRPTEEYSDEANDQEEATLLLPNASRPSTPRHGALFSFKTPSASGGHGSVITGGPGLGGHLHDSSMDARNLIHGFERFDSDEEDQMTEQNTTPLGGHQDQDRTLVSLAGEDTLPSPSQTSSLPPSKALAFAPDTRSKN